MLQRVLFVSLIVLSWLFIAFALIGLVERFTGAG